MACAFGMEACKQYINTKYVRLPDLLIDLEMARNEGTYKKVMAKYANLVLLIIDIVNTGLHFFLKDVRPMLLFVMNHNIVDVSPLVEDRHLQSIFFCYSNN